MSDIGVVQRTKDAHKQLKRVVAASMAGTIVEWYEFFLYGTAATLVFSKIFFPPGTSELTAILSAFITYAVGFFARPVGGVVFGYFGDRYGRKRLLQVSLIVVGGATFLMGCLPTYGQIGIWAPALLVVLRFAQGFALGGEWGGAVLLVAEHSPDNRRGFWTSWPQAGVPGGNLLATVVLLALTMTLSDAAFLSWGWRVGFWLSAVMTGRAFRSAERRGVWLLRNCLHRRRPAPRTQLLGLVGNPLGTWHITTDARSRATTCGTARSSSRVDGCARRGQAQSEANQLVPHAFTLI